MKHIKLFEQFVIESKDNLYLQLHKKYADQIKGLKAKKIKKLTDLVSVQRWAMEDEHDTPGHDHKKMSAVFNNERKLFKQYLAGDHSVMLPESINEAKLRLKVEVPMRDPEIKKFIHNYLLLNKKYSMHRMPEYSMKFGENKSKKETHWKYDTANNILYVHDAKVVDRLVKGGAPSDLFES